MRHLHDLPSDFPGKEKALKWDTGSRMPEYLYDSTETFTGKTTVGEDFEMPFTTHLAMAELDYEVAGGERYIVSGANKIGIELLTDEQLAAVAIADKIQKQIDVEDPTRNTVAHIKRVMINEDGVLCITKSNGNTDFLSSKPTAAVKHVESLGAVTFATTLRGYKGVFTYDKADIGAFVPADLAGEVNAFAVVDNPRLVNDEDGHDEFQIARLMLLNVEADSDYPL